MNPNRPFQLAMACCGLTTILAMAWPALASWHAAPLTSGYYLQLDPSLTPQQRQAADQAQADWTSTTPVSFFTTVEKCHPGQGVICLTTSKVDLPFPLDTRQAFAFQLGQAMGVPSSLPETVTTANDLNQWQVTAWHMARSKR